MTSAIGMVEHFSTLEKNKTKLFQINALHYAADLRHGPAGHSTPLVWLLVVYSAVRLIRTVLVRLNLETRASHSTQFCARVFEATLGERGCLSFSPAYLVVVLVDVFHDEQ